jgi:methylated-DNA-[protein]-cysteine S-methyltransferase
MTTPLSFRDRVREVVRTIPLGETRTYKEVASLAGNPRAARAVGAVLKTNYDSEIPCHRVVKSDGSLGGYNRGVQNKEHILADEKRQVGILR